METVEKEIAVPASAQMKNETFRMIYSRRAVRKFKEEPVERQVIEQLLDAGRMAPSAINKQPWKFYILTQKEDIQGFSKEISKASLKGIFKVGLKEMVRIGKDFLHFSHGSGFLSAPDPIFHGAPVVIFITADRGDEWASLDIGMCAQNIMLAAKSIGLDTCPVGFAKFVMQTKSYSKLNIPQSEQVMLAVVLGHGDEEPPVHERKQNNVSYI